ncbi:hypothetical protein RV18_GL002195 [Enterococcus termitis]|nr:hypothetical protein RV18_GL002195 [Enterococcus termitis]
MCLGKEKGEYREGKIKSIQEKIDSIPIDHYRADRVSR